MRNYGIRVNLQNLQNAFLRKFAGKTATKTCICLPIEDNPSLFLGEKGCYLNLTAYAQENPQYGNSHFVRGDIPRELYEQMTEEQRKSFAILGNMKPILPKQQQVDATTSMDAPEDQPQDDLPF
ncbi:hypothetical protein [uncultured Prevotella sp.]|uniref:hypothetical protein n=1 Tax=uncultured Prevotella sp. TaxID=159272 RepID=UPI0025E5F4E7|nr:hypothetical protein [uncultured Prevotella sp.]